MLIKKLPLSLIQHFDVRFQDADAAGNAPLNEMKRTLFSRRALPVWILAAVPPGIFALVSLIQREAIRIDRVTPLYATIYQGLILQLCVFFGCAWLFSSTAIWPIRLAMGRASCTPPASCTKGAPTPASSC